ncbi:Coiled-coil domain-containing protein 149,Coiled-coil domain-containing protein 149-B,Coiled-coil domain-containing protein 149-A [Mytilus coruscus]|uniref:Coiled-coil domain-containing protein 149,Coiled-coil domain-containing protein 149-B,Coiled-coil domain-containing protein 149-A n=1 Tax=Mytilus coruscus TaxID=42192 RepID=A0A6J8B3C8_MYTCO|nr:Coiled-coil domain-containing protein 149,Coiled-coil domain-containing protein 149-B,Coiled-coil domain-containing protein 149-A [Mytilus coruscus]
MESPLNSKDICSPFVASFNEILFCIDKSDDIYLFQPCYSPTLDETKSRCSTSTKNLGSLLFTCKERNKSLEFEVEDFKQKLHDANGDIKLLREQIARQRVGTSDEGINIRHFPAHEREDLVKQLEASREEINQLERDLQQVIDEKEELVIERVAYKSKYDRLNQELNYILKGDEKRIVDIDALSMENKYLQESLKQMAEEKSMAMATVSKYKNLLERRKTKSSSLKLGQSRSGGLVITQKQELLENWTLTKLHSELRTKNIKFPTNARRMALVRLLKPSSGEDITGGHDSMLVTSQETSARSHNAPQNVNNNNGDRMAILQNVISLNNKVTVLSNNIPQNDSIITSPPVPSSSQVLNTSVDGRQTIPNITPSTSVPITTPSSTGNYSIESALQCFHASSLNRHVPTAAAGSEAHAWEVSDRDTRDTYKPVMVILQNHCLWWKLFRLNLDKI